MLIVIVFREAAEAANLAASEKRSREEAKSKERDLAWLSLQNKRWYARYAHLAMRAIYKYSFKQSFGHASPTSL